MLEKLKRVSPSTWARTLILAITLANEFLNMAGKNPIPVSEELIYQTISNLAVIGAAAWSWWKNNSFTDAAIEADKYKEVLKEDN